MLFTWTSAAVPAAFGIYRAGSRSELPAGPAAWAVHARIQGEGPRGEGTHRDVGGATTPGLAFFEVHAREACGDAPRLP